MILSPKERACIISRSRINSRTCFLSAEPTFEVFISTSALSQINVDSPFAKSILNQIEPQSFQIHTWEDSLSDVSKTSKRTRCCACCRSNGLAASIQKKEARENKNDKV